MVTSQATIIKVLSIDTSQNIFVINDYIAQLLCILKEAYLREQRQSRLMLCCLCLRYVIDPDWHSYTTSIVLQTYCHTILKQVPGCRLYTLLYVLLQTTMVKRDVYYRTPTPSLTPPDPIPTPGRQPIYTLYLPLLGIDSL